MRQACRRWNLRVDLAGQVMVLSRPGSQQRYRQETRGRRKTCRDPLSLSAEVKLDSVEKLGALKMMVLVQLEDPFGLDLARGRRQ